MVKNKDLHQHERRRLLWEKWSYLPNLKLHRAPNSMNAIAPKTAQMNEVRATYANTWAGLSPLSKRALSDRIITEWSENYFFQLFRKGYLNRTLLDEHCSISVSTWSGEEKTPRSNLLWFWDETPLANFWGELGKPVGVQLLPDGSQLLKVGHAMDGTLQGKIAFIFLLVLDLDDK